MTKKRFRRGVAALGILATFFLALMVLLFAPSLASAEKNSGPEHQHADEPHGTSGGAPNPIYSEHSWQEPEKVNWNAPPAGPCADGSCAAEGNKDDTQHFASGSGSREDSGPSSNEHGGNGGHGGSDGQGNGSDSPRNGFAGGYGGGFPGGGSGGGNPQFAPHFTDDGDTDKCNSDSGNSHKCDSDKDNSGKDGSGNGDSRKDGSGDPSGPNIQNPDSPNGSNDLPPVDPEHFTDANPETPPTDRADDLPQQIPEPLTLPLFTVGLAGSVAMRRRVKAK